MNLFYCCNKNISRIYNFTTSDISFTMFLTMRLYQEEWFNSTKHDIIIKSDRKKLRLKKISQISCKDAASPQLPDDPQYRRVKWIRNETIVFLVSFLGRFSLSPLRLSVRPFFRREINGNSSAEDTQRIGRKWSPDDGASSSGASRIDEIVVRPRSCNVRSVSVLSLFTKYDDRKIIAKLD